MSLKREFWFALAAQVVLGALASASLADTAPAEVQYLFVEDAGRGTLTGPDDQHLRLTLSDRF